MRICVEGNRDGRVTQEFLHELRVDTPAEKYRGACVPEVVEADRRQPRTLQWPLEGSVGEQVRAQEAAGAVREDKPPVFPESPELEPLGVLGGPVALEDLYRGARELDASAALGALRCREYGPVVRLRECPTHPERPYLDVHVLPVES